MLFRFIIFRNPTTNKALNDLHFSFYKSGQFFFLSYLQTSEFQDVSSERNKKYNKKPMQK